MHLYVKGYSEEDHTFDPKKEDWACNKDEVLTPVLIQSHVQSVASFPIIEINVRNSTRVWFWSREPDPQ